MSLNGRRLTYVAVLVAAMVGTGWAGTYAAWRAVLGEGTGTAMARFWDLQVESYVTALLVVGALEVVYGLHRADGGGWAFAYRGRRRHVAWYAGLVGLAVLGSAESPLRGALQPLLGDHVGASVALYVRRALEASLAAIGLMLFLDLVRPGGLTLTPPPPSPATAAGGPAGPLA